MCVCVVVLGDWHDGEKGWLKGAGRVGGAEEGDICVK